MNQKQHIQEIEGLSTKTRMLEIVDLRKSFGNNHVLNGFNLELFEGENLVIMGKSGSGKSVMIKCLVGLMQPDSGSIRVMGKDITKLNRVELDDIRTEIGFLFQGNALYDSMTVREPGIPIKKAQAKIWGHKRHHTIGYRSLGECGIGTYHGFNAF